MTVPVPVLRTFLTSRQVQVALAVLALTGVMVRWGGDLNVPVPGAGAPIVLGTLAPLVASVAVLSAADGSHRRMEDIAPRRLGGPRLVLMSSLAVLAGLTLLVCGTPAVGGPWAVALVRDLGILLGIGSIGWLLAGAQWATALVGGAVVVSVTFSSVGGPGLPGWAVLLADADDPVAAACGITGAVVAVTSWYWRDEIVAGRRQRRRSAFRRRHAVEHPAAGPKVSQDRGGPARTG
ncbi:hypothetical protein [Cellulomonas hominis]